MGVSDYISQAPTSLSVVAAPVLLAWLDQQPARCTERELAAVLQIMENNNDCYCDDNGGGFAETEVHLI